MPRHKSKKSVPGRLRKIVASNFERAIQSHPDLMHAKNVPLELEKMTAARGHKVTKSTIHRLRKQQVGISIDAIESIALTLGVPVQSFFVSEELALYGPSSKSRRAA